MIHSSIVKRNDSSLYFYFSQMRPRLASEGTAYTDLSTTSTPFGSLQGRTTQYDQTVTGKNIDRTFRIRLQKCLNPI